MNSKNIPISIKPPPNNVRLHCDNRKTPGCCQGEPHALCVDLSYSVGYPL